MVHGWSRSVHWPAVLRLACGSIPASALTLFALWKLDLKGDDARSRINMVLCFALLLTAISLIFRKALMERYRNRLNGVDERTTAIATVVTGAVLGVLVSISSVGAGAVGVTVLLLLYPRLPMATIVGSDIAHAVPLTLVAGAGHWMLGSVDWGLMGVLLMGSAAGHHHRQLQRDARARTRAPLRAGQRPLRGRRQDHVRGAEPVIRDRHGAGLSH